ncbi:hypothetical protein [Candidatus Neptunichlamydia sp. REUL1]|uniref:hypothetical protein n=1 Tax=Candidatus Neptunichlamydia sp. REUL1 TaxID=3064277 RepID=UPI00292DA59A|nr:hypothetical protein [Candidatus Neptunochlamydia sp. REUL1]
MANPANCFPDRKYLSNPDMPWRLNSDLERRLKPLPSHFQPLSEGESQCKYCVLGPEDHLEWNFIHQYFDRSQAGDRHIKEIRYLHHEGLFQSFETGIKTAEDKSRNGFFDPKWKQGTNAVERQNVFDRWKKMVSNFPCSIEVEGNVQALKNVKILPLLQGSKEALCESICHSGLEIVGKHSGIAGPSSTDPGWFGSGIYLTNSMRYAELYSRYAEVMSGGDPDNTPLHMILSWASMREPYPVINGDGVKLKGKDHVGVYNAHYIPVVPSPVDELVCKPPITGIKNQTPKWDEYCLFSTSQTLPRFWIIFGKNGVHKAPQSQMPDLSTEINALARQLINPEVFQVDSSLVPIHGRAFCDIMHRIHTFPPGVVANGSCVIISDLVLNVFSQIPSSKLRHRLQDTFKTFQNPEDIAKLRSLQFLSERLRNRAVEINDLILGEQSRQIVSAGADKDHLPLILSRVQTKNHQLQRGIELIRSLQGALEEVISTNIMAVQSTKLQTSEQARSQQARELSAKDRQLQQEKDARAADVKRLGLEVSQKDAEIALEKQKAEDLAQASKNKEAQLTQATEEMQRQKDAEIALEKQKAEDLAQATEEMQRQKDAEIASERQEANEKKLELARQEVEIQRLRVLLGQESDRIKSRVDTMGILSAHNSPEFRRAAEARIERLETIDAKLRDFRGLLVDELFIHRRTSFLKEGTTQSVAEFKEITDAFMKIPGMEGRTLIASWHQISDSLSAPANFLDILNPSPAGNRSHSRVILDELKILSQDVHTELHQTLASIGNGLQLCVPRGAGRISWQEIEVERNRPKPFSEKIFEIASRLLARRWIRENNALLRKYLNGSVV